MQWTAADHFYKPNDHIQNQLTDWLQFNNTYCTKKEYTVPSESMQQLNKIKINETVDKYLPYAKWKHYNK